MAGAVLPGEYQTQIDNAQLEKELALQTLKNSKPNVGQMVGPHYVAPGIFGTLGPALERFLGERRLKESNATISKTKAQYEADSLADRGKVLGMLKPGEDTFPTTRNDDEGNDMPIVPGKPADALGAERAAQASRFPQTQALAAELAKQRAAAMTAGAPHAMPDSVMKALAAAPGGDPTKLIGLMAPKEEFGNDPKGNAYVKTVNPKTGQPEIKYAPKETKVRTGDNIVSMGDKKNLASYNAILDDTLKVKAPIAEAAVDNIRLTGEVLNSLPRTQAGITAPISQIVQKLGSAMGIKTDTVEGNDELASQLRQRIMAKLGGKLGAQISDADRSFVESFAGSQLTEKGSLYRLLALDMASSMQVTERYNSQLGELQRQDPETDFSSMRKEFRVGRVDPAIDAMLQKALSGQPIGGMPTPVDRDVNGNPAPQTPARPGKVRVVPWGNS